MDLNPYANLSFKGSPERLNQWVSTLVEEAKSNDYVLVNWFNAFDYDPLWDKSPGDVTDLNDPLGQFKSTFGIWKNMGLWEIPENYGETLIPAPKEGLEIWKSGWGY